MMSEASASTRYVATCLYGLEGILADEVRERLGAEPQSQWCEVSFRFDGSAARLRDLRLAGNVFMEFDRFPIGHTMAELDAMAEHLRAVPLEAWEARWCGLQGLSSGEIGVTVQRRGEHNFTYQDVEERAIGALSQATGRKVTLEPRPLELRIEVEAEWCRLMGRLTPTPLSERPYKRFRSSADTDATLAAAMVRLSRPRPGDLFLDPFCGAGTIPIERALRGRATAVVAGELKEKRVAWAVGNAGLAGVQVAFGCWDALKLPFADRAFTRVVTSPPQSNPVDGRPWGLEDFAPLVAECFRVLQYGGAAVWLMERGPLFKRALKHLGIAYPARLLACNWKGRSWTIYTVEKVM